MNILFVSSSYSNYYAIDDIVRRLYQRGHAVTLILGMEQKETIPDDAIQHLQSDIPEIIIEPLKKRRILRNFTRYIREVLNYAHVLNNEDIRKWDVAKWFRFFPPFLWHIISSPLGRKKLKDAGFQHTLRFVEQKIPVDFAIRKQIQRFAPDIMVVMPLINPNSKENEYLRAAQRLGVPVLYSMVSWDNISSKGTFHGNPDYSVVWNEPLALELSHLHGIPHEKIFVTGAPRFDHLLDRGSDRMMSRSEFCLLAGLNETKDYLLYVGSTFLVTNDYQKNADESDLILSIAKGLANDHRTKDVNLVLRPHPTNSSFLEKLRSCAPPNVFIFPAKGELPDTEEKRNLFHNSIFHSMAVIGVNTTAFLEASALDKPCITIKTKSSIETQQLPHFRHLAVADFLENALSVEDVIRIVTDLKSGGDAHCEQRHEFVRNFLRPKGISAVDTYVDMIEELGGLTQGRADQ